MSKKLYPVRPPNHFVKDRAKLFYSGNQYYDQAFVKVTGDSIGLVCNTPGSYDVSFKISKMLGAAVYGPFAMIAALKNIRVGPTHSFNPMLETGAPSTTFLPIPTLWKMKPFKIDCAGALNKISQAFTGIFSGDKK